MRERPANKILNRKTLTKILKSLKAKNKTIVFTNGCFDILHIGHIRYLKKTKSLGDILIVAINTDASVRKIKPGRPIIPERQRAEVLSALESVDFVTFFGEDTPYKIIKELKPDILVKGGDWEKGDIVGSDLVKKVYSLPYIKGISTTDIINKIKSL